MNGMNECRLIVSLVKRKKSQNKRLWYMIYSEGTAGERNKVCFSKISPLPDFWDDISTMAAGGKTMWCVSGKNRQIMSYDCENDRWNLENQTLKYPRSGNHIAVGVGVKCRKGWLVGGGPKICEYLDIENKENNDKELKGNEEFIFDSGRLEAFAFGQKDKNAEVYFWGCNKKVTYIDEKWKWEDMKRSFSRNRTPRSFESAIVSHFIISVFDVDEIWCYDLSPKTQDWKILTNLACPSKEGERIHVISLGSSKFSIIYKGKDDRLHCFFYTLEERKKTTITLEEDISWSCDVMFRLETVSFLSNDDNVNDDHDNAKLKMGEISMGVEVKVEDQEDEVENENFMVAKQFTAIVIDNDFTAKKRFSLVGGKQPHSEDANNILKYTVLVRDTYPKKCIHEGYVQSLMDIALGRKIRLWDYSECVGGAQGNSFLKMSSTLRSIVKGVFKGMLSLHKEGFEINKECFNANHVVFTNPQNLHPKIIDCLIKSEIGENEFPNFEALSQLIDDLKDIWTSDPKLEKWEPWPPIMSPFVTSFQDMLKKKNVRCGWFEQLLYHPLLMTYEERLEYLERVRDVVRGGWQQIKCSIRDVLGSGVRDWSVLCSDPILLKQFKYDYGDGLEWNVGRNNVKTWVIFLRNAYKHCNDGCYENAKAYLGEHLSSTCPRLLPELFKELGHLNVEEKIDVPKSIASQPLKSKQDHLIAAEKSLHEWWASSSS